MKYELALALKKAGFPQPHYGGSRGLWFVSGHLKTTWEHASALIEQDGTIPDPRECLVYEPTLEELIGSFFTRFDSLTQTEKDVWVASARHDEEGPMSWQDTDAERAVAKLYVKWMGGTLPEEIAYDTRFL